MIKTADNRAYLYWKAMIPSRRIVKDLPVLVNFKFWLKYFAFVLKKSQK
jgi:hypothetical protein